MCKVVGYLVHDMIIVINLSLKSCQFYWYCYVDTESITLYPMLSSTHLLTSSSSSISGSINTPTPNVPLGKSLLLNWFALIMIVLGSFHYFICYIISF